MMSGLNSEKQENKNTVNSKFNAEDADPDILKNMRCTNCSKYFYPKIFLCPKGHNLCTNCKPGGIFNKSVFKETPESSGFGASNESKSQPIFGDAKPPIFGTDWLSGTTAQPIFPRIAETINGGAAQTSGGFNSRGGIIFNRSSSSTIPLEENSVQTKSKPKVWNPPQNSTEQVAMHDVDNYYCWICKTLFRKDAARRNVAKEKSLKILDFPCGNLDNGCQYRDKLHQIEEHENICIFKKRSCFFENCEWNGTTYAITDHLHKHSVVTMNKTENLTQGKNVYSILYDSTFFLLKTNYVPCNTLAFSLSCPANGIKYKYEICFMGYNDHVLIGLSNYCETLMNENVESDDPQSEYIPLPFDFFKNFLVDVEKIRFKINITKIE